MDHVALEKQLDAFKQEVSTFRNTRHDNLVLFLGVCLELPDLGIVMDLCKGQTLHTVIHQRREKFDPSRIVTVAIQICRGMSYLHTKNIIHKDLRSKNIFLEGPVRAVITDFGLFSMQRLCERSEKQDVTRFRVPERWLCYLSPEIMRCLQSPFNKESEPVDLPFSDASDVYAFGTIWFEMLARELPFNRYTPETIVYHVGCGIKPPISNIQAAKEAKELLMHTWNYRPEERPSFQELQQLVLKMPKRRITRSPSHPVNMSRSAESIF
jgi:kinase suppressor of Ras 2